MKIEKVCPICGKTFEVTECFENRRKYCSLDCRNKGYRKKREERTYYYCKWCGEMLPKNSTHKYCSESCELKATRNSASGRTNKKRKKKGLSIDEISRLAKAEGLSYGKYVLKMEMEKGANTDA